MWERRARPGHSRGTTARAAHGEGDPAGGRAPPPLGPGGTLQPHGQPLPGSAGQRSDSFTHRRPLREHPTCDQGQLDDPRAQSQSVLPSHACTRSLGGGEGPRSQRFSDFSMW